VLCSARPAWHLGALLLSDRVVVMSHGPAARIKEEFIEEEFGDGIMSAIDFRMDIQRLHDAAGERESW